MNRMIRSRCEIHWVGLSEQCNAWFRNRYKTAKELTVVRGTSGECIWINSTICCVARFRSDIGGKIYKSRFRTDSDCIMAGGAHTILSQLNWDEWVEKVHEFFKILIPKSMCPGGATMRSYAEE
jgi:hypothetical protein